MVFSGATVSAAIYANNHINTWSLNFYMSNALREAQPTVSKHWKLPLLAQYVVNNTNSINTNRKKNCVLCHSNKHKYLKTENYINTIWNGY